MTNATISHHGTAGPCRRDGSYVAILGPAWPSVHVFCNLFDFWLSLPPTLVPTLRVGMLPGRSASHASKQYLTIAIAEYPAKPASQIPLRFCSSSPLHFHLFFFFAGRRAAKNPFQRRAWEREYEVRRHIKKRGINLCCRRTPCVSTGKGQHRGWWNTQRRGNAHMIIPILFFAPLPKQRQ